MVGLAVLMGVLMGGRGHQRPRSHGSGGSGGDTGVAMVPDLTKPHWTALGALTLSHPMDLGAHVWD